MSSPVVLNLPYLPSQFLGVKKQENDLSTSRSSLSLSLSLPSWATRLTAHVHLWCAVELHLLRIHCGTWDSPSFWGSEDQRNCQSFQWLGMIDIDIDVD